MVWDYKKEDKIEFFDRTKSYEITGYRPIDSENGLDFVLHPFIEDATTFRNKGSYSDYKMGTKAYSDFWDERYDRIEHGYTVGDYRITGDNYYFINYYRLLSAATDNVDDDFPVFTNVQYEWFHYVEMCELLGWDCIALKARGVNSCPIN